jgi:CDGSH-type Zn-finger protein
VGDRGAHADERATITPYPDGPYLVRGAFRLLDHDGNELDAQRRTVALCRCGRSRLRPFCDGTHRLIGFRAPGGDGVTALGSGADRGDVERL